MCTKELRVVGGLLDQSKYVVGESFYSRKVRCTQREKKQRRKG
jgi:hypothetical protein